ncbi:MAG TPA: DUF6156 family protein [Methylocella sp.]|nr:DUF6156 family protein [Methylocella sp.]
MQEGPKYFVSYTGTDLPFHLINPIGPDGLTNRNTFIRAYFNGDGRLARFEKIVYGEIELSHRYEYYTSGTLKSAEIAMQDEEPLRLSFDETGQRLANAEP